MNKFLLGMLDIFQGIYRLAGVNYAQLRAIVDLKLTMDNRRQMIGHRKKETKETSSSFLMTLFFYTLFGGFVALFILGTMKVFAFSMLVFFSYIMVMIAMTLITDFSAILLDTSDNTIILPRPVESRTLFAARITHIVLYLGQISLGLSIIPALVVFVKYGALHLVVFLLATMLSVLTSLFITNAIYLLVLQFASEEKLKNVINYFQIVMAVVFMGGYQLLPRLAGRFDPESVSFEIHWWSFFTPPVWMAGAMESIHLRVFDAAHIILMACAVVIPVLGVYFVNRYLAPVFTAKLGVMAVETRRTTTSSRRSDVANKISKWVTVGSIERGSFELIYHLLGRDRKIKLKIYPTFGYVVIFGLIFMFRDREDLLTTWNNLPNGQFHLVLLYLTFMILQVAYYEVPFSDDFKASWIYFSAPVNRPGEILSGALKAILFRIFIPGYVIISLAVVLIWGVRAIDDIVFGFFNNMMMLFILVMINKRTLPFALAPSARNHAGNFIRTMVIFILIGALGMTHYWLSKFPLVLLAAIPAQMIIVYFLYKDYRNTPWSQVTL